MLNPHTFPLVPYPGLAPELAVRSAMGEWPAYALPVPADRLLPFVLARAMSDANSPWLNCARLEHADTGAVLFELQPTGASANPLDLVLRKYVDTAGGVEYFAYLGGQIPGLDLPCGQPVRLVLDNAWQGPRCVASVTAGDFLLLEWWNDGPTGGVPYGRGFRQRLYVENGALLHGEPIRQRTVTKVLADESERVDAVALTRTATVSVPPVPAYLTQALEMAEAVGRFEADGDAWQLSETKQTSAGADSGRWSVALSLRQRLPTRYRASCPPPPLAESAFDTTRDAPHPWRCGDVADTSPDWQTTARTCAVDAQGDNTGYLTLSQRDVNPQSPGFGTTRTAPYQEGPDDQQCPRPPRYYSAAVAGVRRKNDCGPGFEGAQDVYFQLPYAAFSSTSSQAAADALAAAAFADQAQANANAAGACQPAGQWRPAYTASGCFACRMENIADPAQTRDPTPDERDAYYRPFVYDEQLGAAQPCPQCLI